MEVKHRKYYDEAATMPVDLKTVFPRVQQNVDFFLEAVKKDYPESYEKLIKVLTDKFHRKEELPVEVKVEKDAVNPELTRGVFDYILAEMKYWQYKSEHSASEEKLEIKTTDFLRSLLFYNYNFATTLTEILPRDKAISYYKEIINQRIRSQRDPKNYVESLEKSRKRGREFFEIYQGHNFTEFKLNDGKMGMKFTKCKWYEIMKELNDPEFCYAVSCHGDFEATKNENSAFEMTRTRTLMQGDGYCDFCHHDTRVVEEISHPSDEFWDNLE